jgi:signal transduction histidine kinase
MREVSCRALAPIFAYLDARGIPRSELVEGTGTSLPLLERTSQRIDWEIFGDLCVRLEGLVGLEGLAEIGASPPKIPAMRALAAVLGTLTDPVAIYNVMLKVVGPSMFHHTLTRVEDLGGGRLRATIAFPPEYRDVPGVFYIFLGGLRINPTLCGYPPAEVEMTLAPRKAVYDVRFARPEPGLLQRIGAMLRGAIRLSPGLREMEAQRTELQASYEALRDAQRRIRRQQTLLRKSGRRRRQAEQARSLAEEQFHRAQKLEGIGLLAGGIAHDFNNLLASILGNAELALKDAEADQAPRVPVTLRLARIQRGAERAAELTSQLLVYAGRRPTTMRELDVNTLFADTQLLRAAVPRNIVMHELLTPDLPGVSADPIQLQQVIVNLLTNAAAAVEPNGGEVTLHSGVAQVDAERLARGWLRTDAPPGEFVFVEIRDTGVGMDDATLARIFDPFFTTRAHGRGLGLAAVLGIVRAHLGIIEVVSAPGVGSTFRVLLPSLGHPPTVLAAAPPPEPTRRKAGTILVVDDERSVLECTSDLLKAQGYSVIAASDGEAALETARRFGDRIDAYLVDRTMPRMSGEEVFHALRALRPGARVLLVSGYHDMEGLPALEAQGLAGSLSKPFGSVELADAMGRLLPSNPP